MLREVSPPRASRAAPLLAAAAALTAAACLRRVEPPAAPPAAPPVPAALASADPGWPARLELEMVDGNNDSELTPFSINTTLPVFRSEPPQIAAALNARFAKLARPPIDPRTHEGSYTVTCTMHVANRFAVIFDCTSTLEAQPRDEALQVDDRMVESRTIAHGFWLRRGLPALSFEQFAPSFDLRAALAAAAAAAPAGCEIAACGLDRQSIVLNGDGLGLTATEPCGCDGALPTIPLDELHPTHAWAVDLVSRLRRRVEAGNELVEGERTH